MPNGSLRKDTSATLFLSSLLLFTGAFWLNTLSLSWGDESVIFAKFWGIYKNKAGINACKVEMIWLILGKGIRGADQLRCRKTKLYLNPMWPLFATNIAQYEKKSHHWASCHINYTHGPIIHENASFGDFKKMLSFGFVKQQMQKKTSVVFHFSSLLAIVFIAEWWDEGSD